MMFRYIVFIVIGSSVLSVLLITSLVWIGQDAISAWFTDLDTATETVPVTVSQSRTDLFSSSTEPIADMVAAVNPAVVSIVATKDMPIYERVYEEYSPFGGFFGGSIAVPRLRESGTEEREVGGGSGFIVSPEGLLITNRHVVSDAAANYSALFSDGEALPVTVLARDDVFDIAVLQIASSTNKVWPYLPLGDSDKLRLGQQVVVIGNALAEFDNTVSTGVISGLSRSITARGRMGSAEQLDRVIQTDAAINPGNSGGPLLNLQGEVVGVNVAASLGAQNIGFALPINALTALITSVQETGQIVRPFLGVRYRAVTERMVSENNLSVSFGAIVLRGEDPDQLAVVPGSPAAKAGVQEGDIILAINGTLLQDQTLASALRAQAVGDTVNLRIWRNGTEITLPVTLEAM